MRAGLFVKKSIKDLVKEAEETPNGLKRTLTAWNLTTFGVGAIIGAGIFVLTGQAAAQYAGPAVVLSFVIAGLLSLFAAFCYAELSALIPISGSAYAYTYVTMGEFAAWIMGWVLTLEYLFSATTVAVGWSGYCVSFLKDLGIYLPESISQAPLLYDVAQGWVWSGSVVNLPAVLVVGFIGFMIALGIKAAQRFNDLMVYVKMIVILLFLICGIFYVNTANWSPFIPENTGVFGQYGWSGVFRGAGLVFFAFIGFDALSTLAQEARNPQKDMPLGMLGSLSVSTIAYVLVALLVTGLVAYTQLGVADPIAVAVNAMGAKFLWLRFVVNIAILAGLTTVILVMLLGQTRIFYSMARDGLLPKVFGKIHPRYRTPFFTTILFTLIAMVISGLFPVVILGELTSMGALSAFAIVCFGVLVLRYKQPKLHRPFKVPLFPLIPILGTVASVALMLFLSGVTWLQLIIWLVVGAVIYFVYGRKHSRVRKKTT